MTAERVWKGGDMLAEVRSHLVSSRLLVLQSKRLMLNSLERRHSHVASEWLADRIVAARMEAELAQHAYRTCVLSWGSTDRSDYWVVAYSRLIEVGNTLTSRLRSATVELPLAERYQASADVEMLEDIVGSWSDSLRTAMAAAVA